MSYYQRWLEAFLSIEALSRANLKTVHAFLTKAIRALWRLSYGFLTKKS